MKNRETDFEIMGEIQNRWSPRAFDPARPLAREDIMALLEAARFAPSCFNEQPWRFIIADDEKSRQKMLGVLYDGNSVWAVNAPVLIMLLSKQNFGYNDKNNRWHLFDAGTAWGYLSLEAQRRGLITHAMGGFSQAKAREVFGVGEEYSLIAVVAVGYYGDRQSLGAQLLQSEQPSPRMKAEELILE